MAITVDMLRLTGDPRAADELELSTWNAVLGAQNASGRWWTYNTPMDGDRTASAHHIVFQARAGTPELNCCSVNAPRGLGLLSEWAVMRADDGVAVNWYGPCRMRVAAPSGAPVTIEQETDYPLGGKVSIRVAPKRAEEFALRLRMPGWSPATRVTLNGRKIAEPEAGTWQIIERRWKRGDTVRLTFDMAPRLWVGERECEDRFSLYHGPVLLAYDPRFDEHDPRELPPLDLSGEPQDVPPPEIEPRPLLLKRWPAQGGGHVTLCDFAGAGAAGNTYVSWVRGRCPAPAPFSRENPLRAVPIR